MNDFEKEFFPQFFFTIHFARKKKEKKQICEITRISCNLLFHPPFLLLFRHLLMWNSFGSYLL